MTSKIICYFPGSGATTIAKDSNLYADHARVIPMSTINTDCESLVDICMSDIDTIPNDALFAWVFDILNGFADSIIFLPAHPAVFAWLEEEGLAHYLVTPTYASCGGYVGRRNDVARVEVCLHHAESSVWCHTIRLPNRGFLVDTLPEIMQPYADLVATIIKETDWIRLSVTQMAHDMTFHPDIFYKSNPDKMSHYALHFAKYMGRVWDAQRHPTTKTMTDTLSIVLGVAYTLKIDLGKIAYEPVPTASFREIYTKAAGQVCGAYLALIGDRVDHFEAFKSDALGREALCAALGRLRDVAVDILVLNGYNNPVLAYNNALQKTREKHIAYDYLNNQYQHCLRTLLEGDAQTT